MIVLGKRAGKRSRHPTSTENKPGWMVPITDVRTGRVHLVTDEAMVAGRRAGCYLAVCGGEALAASLMAEAGKFCQLCRQQVRR